MSQEISSVDTAVLLKAAVVAIAAKGERYPSYGCGRVYVGFSGVLKANSRQAAMLTAAGFKLTPRPNQSGRFIYVGYDNATGIELGKGEAIAKAFQANGVQAYMDADGD